MTRTRYRLYVTYELDRVSSLARAEASKIYMRECGLDIRALRVLRCVAENPGLSVTEVVEATMFERTLVSKLITELVAKGLLLRRIASADARQFEIDITAEGLRKADIADELGDRLNEDLLSCLEPNEREVFAKCLKRLVQWRPKSAEPSTS